MVLGPKKLPGTARQIGRWVGRARVMARQFREQLELEVSSVDKALDSNPGRATPAKPATTAATASAAGAAAAPHAAPRPESAVEPEPEWQAPFTTNATAPQPVPQPHPESSMVVHPEPVAEAQHEPQAQLPFGDAPSSTNGAASSRRN